MKFSIVTPSFRSSRWLKLCIASVADQGVEVEHIVQDACSDDGTEAWLRIDERVRAFFEKDDGMYDGINRGLKRSTGDILAYLNCDEQYLPGTLQAVGRCFAEHPSIDVLFGDAIVVGATGGYLFHRPVLIPNKPHTQVSGSLAILSCATFFRRRLVDEKRLFFDTRYRVVGDVRWILDLLDQRVSMGLLHGFTSVFTKTGENLSFNPAALDEARAIRRSAPLWTRSLRALVVGHHRLRKLAAGHYWSAPFDYAIYTAESPERRVVFHVPKPTAIWRAKAS
jgi:glycosyltransferase involved in cell wall biosynthesis